MDYSLVLSEVELPLTNFVSSSPLVDLHQTYELIRIAYWIDKGVLGLNGVIGCFAMTELAHGSNVAGLETTATFDEDTDEFVIHTPHLGATKWWIGGAASTATHAAVFAQLIVKGKRHGVKTFVTQLRDTK